MNGGILELGSTYSIADTPDSDTNAQRGIEASPDDRSVVVGAGLLDVELGDRNLLDSSSDSEGIQGGLSTTRSTGLEYREYLLHFALGAVKRTLRCIWVPIPSIVPGLA